MLKNSGFVSFFLTANGVFVFSSSSTKPYTTPRFQLPAQHAALCMLRRVSCTSRTLLSCFSPICFRIKPLGVLSVLNRTFFNPFFTPGGPIWDRLWTHQKNKLLGFRDTPISVNLSCDGSCAGAQRCGIATGVSVK